MYTDEEVEELKSEVRAAMRQPRLHTWSSVAAEAAELRIAADELAAYAKAVPCDLRHLYQKYEALAKYDALFEGVGP